MTRGPARAFLAACVSCAATAAMASAFTVRVVDDNGRPLEGAFIVAREFMDEPKLHGSRTFCAHADAAPASRGTHEALLPGAGLGQLLPGRRRALDAFAYAKGQCVASTLSGRAAARSLSVPEAYRAVDAGKAVQRGQAVTLRARPATNAEDRLEYLLNMTAALACEQWSERSRDGLASLVSAIQAEAGALPRESAYAKALSQRLKGELAATSVKAVPGDGPRGLATFDPAPPPPRNFIIAAPGTPIRWPAEEGGMVVMAVNRGSALSAASPAMPPGAVPQARALQPPRPASSPSAQAQLVVHCRPGSSCSLDERDASGKTAIYEAAAKLDVERVTFLLEHGADPSVAVDRFGANAIDALVRRAIMQPPAAGSIDAERARAVIDLIAASPKARIRERLAQQLAAEPGQWIVKAPETVAILTHAREKLRSTATIPEGGGCQLIEPEARSGEFPVTLR